MYASSSSHSPKSTKTADDSGCIADLLCNEKPRYSPHMSSNEKPRSSPHMSSKRRQQRQSTPYDTSQRRHRKTPSPLFTPLQTSMSVEDPGLEDSVALGNLLARSKLVPAIRGYRSPGVNTSMRDILVRWMFEVGTQYFSYYFALRIFKFVIYKKIKFMIFFCVYITLSV